METIYSISVTEALEELNYPSFFERDERRAAYEKVMLWGSSNDRLSAEIAKNKYPFDEPDTFFSLQSINDFPIVGEPQRA